MAGGVSSNTGVSDYANTTDGRAYGVSALNSGGTDAIGGHGVSVQFGSEPGAISHILSQDGNFIITESGDMLITQG
jgi:hypothetical protein